MKAELTLKNISDFKESRVQSSSDRILFFKRLIDNPAMSSSPCGSAQLLCDVASSLRGAAAAAVSDPLPHHSFKWLLSTPMAPALRWLHIYPQPLHLQYLAPIPSSPSLDFFQQCFSWSYQSSPADPHLAVFFYFQDIFFFFFTCTFTASCLIIGLTTDETLSLKQNPIEVKSGMKKVKGSSGKEANSI